MATRLEAVAALVRHAAIAKVCQDAMELHGGSGAMLEVGIEKYFRDAAVSLHSDGTTDVSNFKIARSMFPETAGLYVGPE